MATIPAEHLKWLRGFIAEQRWQFARTYADTYPHEYNVRNWHRDPTDWDRATHILWAYGHIENFYKLVNAYLVVDDWKYWQIDNVLNRTDQPDKMFGTQWSPRTWTDRPATEWDWLALTWRQFHPSTSYERNLMTGRLRALRPADTILDVGCGSGIALDMRGFRPDNYLGIDPSSGMLNQFVKRYRGYTVEPVTVAEFTTDRTFSHVYALFGSASELTAEEIDRCHELGRETFLMFHPDSVDLLDYAARPDRAHIIDFGRWPSVLRVG